MRISDPAERTHVYCLTLFPIKARGRSLCNCFRPKTAPADALFKLSSKTTSEPFTAPSLPYNISE